ncbi:TIGR02996 domain-containing protein [Gemmata sp.]|uniref:TIGR02996 domain-containing protein n=1 Tax=Gemmata sp. TaxID=1914242 RepID=UPI003F71A414
MGSQHDALYRAICAEPDEDTPRLAFADLVEEEGDAPRAAFIRAQVALARVAEYDPLAVATRQHNPDAFHGWAMAHTLPPVPGGYGWHKFAFRRGLPWMAGVSSLAAFVAGGESVFDAAPVQALSVDPRDRPDLSALAAWPHLARVRRLEFTHGWFGADAVAQLGDSPHAANLVELALEHDGVTAAGLEALAESAVFPRLEALELRSNAVPPALIVDALAAARRPGALGRLSLADNSLAEADAGHLFALPVVHGLRALDLSDNKRLGVAGAQALAGSGALRGLRVLRVAKTLPGVPGVEALAGAGGIGSLRVLDLSENRLGPVAVKLVAESGAARGLKVLNLAHNPVGDLGAAAIANARAFSGLLELDLGSAEVGDRGAVALAESPHLGNLLRLNLVGSQGPRLGRAARDALVERFGRRVSV